MVCMGSHFYRAKDFQVSIRFSMINNKLQTLIFIELSSGYTKFFLVLIGK
jgi:hypothetical protein